MAQQTKLRESNKEASIAICKALTPNLNYRSLQILQVPIQRYN
jgi:hypothetical protein